MVKREWKCVIIPNSVAIGLTVAEIWRFFIFFQNGGLPLYWICYAPVRTSHECRLVVFVTVWNRCSSFDNIRVLIFCELGPKTPIHDSKWFFWEGFDPLNGELSHRDPQQALHCAKKTSYVILFVKIRPSMRAGASRRKTWKGKKEKNILKTATCDKSRVHRDHRHMALHLWSATYIFHVSSKSVQGFWSHGWVEIWPFPLLWLLVFSERELAFAFAICCRLSLCRLSVTLARPTQPVKIFRNVSMPFGTLATNWHPRKILRRSPREPLRRGGRGVKRKRGS